MTLLVWLGTALITSALIFQTFALAIMWEKREAYKGYDWVIAAFAVMCLRRGTALYLWTSLSSVSFPLFLDKALFPLAISLLLYVGALVTVAARGKPGEEVLSDKEASVEYARIRTLFHTARRNIEKAS